MLKKRTSVSGLILRKQQIGSTATILSSPFDLAGVVGKTSGYTLVDSRTLHLHERSTLRGDALAAHRRVDAENSISAAQRLGDIRMPDIYDSAHRPSSISYYSWLVQRHTHTFCCTVLFVKWAKPNGN